MSRGPGVVQRRILEALERVDEQFSGAWVLRRDLVTPKEDQKEERSDRASTARAIDSLARRGRVEVRTALYGHGHQKVVRLAKAGRPRILSAAEDQKIHTDMATHVFPVNNMLRNRGSRVRLNVVRAEEVEPEVVFDMTTGKSYQAVYLY